jgi:hypothetical protein
VLPLMMNPAVSGGIHEVHSLGSDLGLTRPISRHVEAFGLATMCRAGCSNSSKHLRSWIRASRPGFRDVLGTGLGGTKGREHRLRSAARMIGETGIASRRDSPADFKTAMSGTTRSARSTAHLGTVSMPPRICSWT